MTAEEAATRIKEIRARDAARGYGHAGITMTEPIGGEWSGAIIDAPSCNCLCFAVHPEKGICDLEAPRALLSMDTAGSMLGDQGVREIFMCQPCAEAAASGNPRARGYVVLAALAD